MNVMDHVFGKHASDISRYFSESRNWFSEVTDKTLTAANKAVQMGKSPILGVKPVALGGAAAVALAVALSDPPVTAGSAPRVQPDLKSGTGGSSLKLNMGVHPGSANSPRAPIPPNPARMGNTARIAGPDTAGRMRDERYRVNVRGTSEGSVNYNVLANDINNSLGGNVTVNTRISDSRRSLTAQNISDILARG